MLLISLTIVFLVFPITSNLVFTRIMGNTIVVVIVLDSPAFRKPMAPLVTYSCTFLGRYGIHFFGILFLNSLSILCSPVKNIALLTPFFIIESPQPLKNPMIPYYEYIFFVSFHSLDAPIIPLVFLNDDMLDVLSTSKGCVRMEERIPISKFLRRSLCGLIFTFSINKIIS